MNRRRYLATTLTLALPGCLGTAGYRPAAEATPTDSDGQAQLVGRQFTLNVERRGEPDEQATISVLAKNVGNAPVEDVHFQVVVEDRDDAILERHTASLDGLEADEAWRHTFDLAATRDEIGGWSGEFVHEEEGAD